MKPGKYTLGQGLSVLAAIVWSLTSPGLKYMLETYHSSELALAFWRDAIIAVACIAALLLLKPGLLRIQRREAASLAVIGAISIGVYHGLWIWSIALNGAAIAVVMIYLFPTFVSVGSWLLFGERLRWTHVAALCMSLAGCALLVRLYDPAVFRISWLGTLVGLLTALTHTVYVLFNQRSVHVRSAWTSLTYSMLFGALTLLGLVVASAAWRSIQPAEAASFPAATQQAFWIGSGWMPWLVISALALGPTLGGYAIFTQALRFVPGRVASLIVVVEAPISTVLAVWLLGEQLAWPQVIGMAMILGAIGLPRLLERLDPALALAETPAA
jgi:drug/metabolite transporter (DMT)-like permease